MKSGIPQEHQMSYAGEDRQVRALAVWLPEILPGERLACYSSDFSVDLIALARRDRA
jgi:hypothetical protein